MTRTARHVCGSQEISPARLTAASVSSGVLSFRGTRVVLMAKVRHVHVGHVHVGHVHVGHMHVGHVHVGLPLAVRVRLPLRVSLPLSPPFFMA
jgi:hypothetical protein